MMVYIDKKTKELCIVEGSPVIHSGNSSIFTQEDFQERFSCISKNGKIDVEKMMELLAECREIIWHYTLYDCHPDWDDLANEVKLKLDEVLE